MVKGILVPKYFSWLRLALIGILFWESLYIGESFLLFFSILSDKLNTTVNLVRDFFRLIVFLSLLLPFLCRGVSNIKKIFIVLLGYFFAALLLLMIPIFPLLQLDQFPQFYSWLFFTAYIAQLFILLLFYVNQSELQSFALFFIPPLSLFLLYFFSFYPGPMSFDSIMQWHQLSWFRFLNWHPVFHTMIMWFLTRFWYSPAIVSLFQIILVSLVFLFAMHYLKSRRVPTALLVVLTLYFALHPVHGGFTIILWKDIPFSAMMLWLTLISMKIADSKGEWLRKPGNLFLVLFILVNVSFLRHNGIAPVAGFFAGLILFFWKRWLPVITLVLLFAGAFYTIKGPLYSSFQMKSGFPGIAFGITHQLAAVIHNGGTLTEQEWKFLTNILSRNAWKNMYSKYESSMLIDPKVIPFINKNHEELVRIWLQIIRRHPRLVLQHMLESSSLVWRISHPPKSYFFTFCHSLPENPYGITQQSKFPGLMQDIKQMYRNISGPKYNFIFTRPAIYFYLTTLFALLAFVRGGRLRYLFPFFPVLANVMALALVLPAQDTRFMLPVYFILPVMVGYFFSLKPSKDGQDHLNEKSYWRFE